MGKVLWHTMMSLDGFIAGPNDDMEWAFGLDGGPSRTVEEILQSVGALLVGRRTQDVEDRLQPGFYGGAFRGPFFVLRHDPPSQPPAVKGVTGQFVDVGIGEAVRLAKQARTTFRSRSRRNGSRGPERSMPRSPPWTSGRSFALPPKTSSGSPCHSRLHSRPGSDGAKGALRTGDGVKRPG